MKFHTFSLGAEISTSFSNCKDFSPHRSYFCYQKSAELATQCEFFLSSAGMKGAATIDSSR
jgi:hypothetical protein